MATDKQIQANKSNGGKSKGPKSVAGKAVSRLNRVSHGMRAALPLLPGEDADERDRQRASLFQELDPVGHLEESLVDSIHASLWSLDRCRLHEAAVLSVRMLKIENDLRNRAEGAAEKLWEWVQVGAVQPVQELRLSAAGCAALTGRWLKLKTILDAVGFWDDAHFQEALEMCAWEAWQVSADPRALTFVAAHAALTVEKTTGRASTAASLGSLQEPCFRQDETQFQRYVDRVHAQRPTRAVALEQLQARVAEELDGLKGYQAAADASLARAIELERAQALFDPGELAQLRQRYVASLERTRGQALRELAQVQKARREWEAEEALVREETVEAVVTPPAPPAEVELPNEPNSAEPSTATPYVPSTSVNPPCAGVSVLAAPSVATTPPAHSAHGTDCERTL